MENQHVLRELLFLNKHLLPIHSMTDKGVGIIYCELEKGKFFGFEQAPAHQLLIFMGGSCTVSYGEFVGRKFSAGQMVFIHRHSCYIGQVLEDMKLLIMSFEAPVGKYDRIVLNCQVRNPEVKYDFHPTPIRYPLTEFFHLLVYCLQEGVNPPLLYEQKHQEIFIYLTAFYTKEELAHLFHEVMGKSIKFREFIYEYYENVNTLDELIELSDMSRAVFFRKFKEEFKETAYQWMLKQKCHKILCYLERPEITIKDVIDTFKFSSFSNFNRFCKSNYGCTPRQLIEKVQQ